MKNLILFMSLAFTSFAFGQQAANQQDCDTTYERAYIRGYESVAREKPAIIRVDNSWQINYNGICNSGVLGYKNGKSDAVLAKKDQSSSDKK